MAKNLIAGTTTTIVENGSDISVDLNTNYKNIVNSVGDSGDLTTTDKTSLVNAINEIESALYFKDGETYTLGHTIFCPGFVTGGTKQLDFSYTLPKSTAKITSVTINQMDIVGRGISGYLNGDGTYFSCIASPYSTTYRLDDNKITFLVDKTTAFTNTSNNTPVSVSLGGGFSITFHE